MGVPKFFRYISERYPCLSEVVKEYQIPQFDNLYLDMNGIIHNCSHPDDNNPHFRITEENIFSDIFHYIEVLFRMIRPQKLFFMAIDGVAPRAKMNQQRGRRFRVAKDAKKQEDEAKKKGEKLPEAARFDSNCITPGTVFMARLQAQLKYFVVDKISKDPLWRKCKIILSGHETPGEGEHKIMDYIRYMRSQPGYDPNTRHCLYGLDADLIMLGLCTHEPHFSLLREEVKFGKKSTKRVTVPEEIKFFLLHLSLMREYLELEFISVKDQLKGFQYDFEKIIDDWVLMGFLVGNDFIPNLPNLHINNGALPLLYKAYMEILPTLDGYINESGTLNLSRFEKFLNKLGEIDMENFRENMEEIAYIEAKTGTKWQSHMKVSTGKNLEEWKSDEEKNENFNDDRKPMDDDLAALIQSTEECLEISDDSGETDEDEAFLNYKKDYYRNKLEYVNVTPEVMQDQALGYVRAIQWNLNYYYNGVCSWSWYYPHHYAPYISDIKDFSGLKIDFDLGAPFKPYEQLMGVLPTASKSLLPTCYHPLMTEESSIIKKYYPDEFQTDLNGKQQEWEAVVLIPFMDEKLLLKAMEPYNANLTPEESERNTHGPMVVFSYDENDLGPYSAPEYFPTVQHSHARVETLAIEDIRVPIDKLVKGAYPGVKMDVYYPGFPTMKHLKYTAELKKAKVKVFEQPSRYENMIVSIVPEEKYLSDEIPTEILGTTIFVAWPHLVEARVVSISNSERKYISLGTPNEYKVEERVGNKNSQFKAETEGIVERYKNRLGIQCGEVKTLVTVQIMTGRKYVFTNTGRLTLEKQFSEFTQNYPIQTIVRDISVHDDLHSAFRDVLDVFKEGTVCFTLTNPYYGSQGVVLNSTKSIKNGRIKVCVSVTDEPDMDYIKKLQKQNLKSYKTLYNAASQLGMGNYLFSKITGSIYLLSRNKDGELKSVAAGLDLKFNKKNKETPGYTRKVGSIWYYTDKVVDLVRQYAEKFPELIDYLNKDDRNDQIMADSVFGDKWDEKIKELKEWLKSIPTANIERQNCGGSTVVPEIIQEIEKIADSSSKDTPAKNVTMQVKPSFLYKPELQVGSFPPDPKMNVTLFDRVVNIRDGFTVPFGLKGTITAISETDSKSDLDTMYDVIFDEEFKGGLALNCSPGRGYRLPKTAFINMSYGKRLLEEKSGRPEDLIAKADGLKKPQSVNEGPHHPKQFVPMQVQNQSQYRAQFPQMQPRPQLMGPEQHYLPQPPRFFQPHPAHYPQQYPQVPFYNPPPMNQQNSAFVTFNSTKVHKMACNTGNSFPNGTKSQEQKSMPDFMPQFTNKPKSSNGNGSNEKTVYMMQPENPNRNVQSVVNTDFLKSVLKIGETPQKQNNNKESVTSTVEMSSNVSFEMFAQVATAPASVRLLTYYQSNGLGLPRYQYINRQGVIEAQITLPNGELIVGKPASSENEATENVATTVLNILINQGTPNFTNSLKGFPVPPKTWVNPKPTEPSSQKPKVQPNNNTPFVPLQALKRQIKTTKSQPGQGNLVEKEKDSPKTSSERKNTIQKDKSVCSTSQSKPKQQRKPRIVANFEAAKKS